MRWMALVVWMVVTAVPSLAETVDVAAHLKTLHAIGPKGQGNREAVGAWKALSRAEASQLPEILAGLDRAGPLAANYIRAAIDAIAERELAGGGKLPADALEKFTLNRQHSPRGRRMAFEWLTKVDAQAPDRIIPKMLDDPSLELRRDAVARVLQQGDAAQKADRQGEAVTLFRQALAAAREVDQVQQATRKLRKLNEEVDVPVHFGFVLNWKLIGPFDNTNQGGFNVAYPPEKEYRLDATYDGKDGAKVKWIEHTTNDEWGNVDLTKALDKFKGAVAYAANEFVVDREQEVDIRVGCINAVKVWVNGEPLMAHEKYHTAMEVDQYVARAKLKPGKNVILLKVCQNEQTEVWAQRWQFQVRVCDPLGTAILARDRPRVKTVPNKEMDERG